MILYFEQQGERELVFKQVPSKQAESWIGVPEVGSSHFLGDCNVFNKTSKKEETQCVMVWIHYQPVFYTEKKKTTELLRQLFNLGCYLEYDEN